MLKNVAIPIHERLIQAHPRDKELLPDPAPYQNLAQEYLMTWQQVHGAPEGSSSTLAGPGGLAILIENAFSPAEYHLAQRADGPSLLQQYIDQLVDQIMPGMITRVEQVTGRSVAMNHISSNIEHGWLIIFFKFDRAIPATAGRNTEA